jgi:hypothetical protein
MQKLVSDQERDVRCLTFDLNVNNSVHQLGRQSIEQDYVINSVQELGRELRLDDGHYRLTRVGAVRAFG